MSMREEFEAAVRAHQKAKLGIDEETMDAILERTSRGGYASIWLQGAWWAWQASRAALEVELPDTVANTGTLTSNAVLSYKRECRVAIEAAGVRVKP